MCARPRARNWSRWKADVPAWVSAPPFSVGRLQASRSRTRRKPIHGGSMAPCSSAPSCALGKTGAGRPAQPVRRMRRTHGANGPGSAGLQPLDTLRVADAGLRVGIELAAEERGCSCRRRGKLSGGGGPPWPGPLAPWMAPSSTMDGLLRVQVRVARPLKRRNRQAPQRPSTPKPQTLENRKARTRRAFSVPAAATGAP